MENKRRSFSKIETLADAVITSARKKKRMLVTVESCTGGLLAHSLTNIPGASEVFERGWVTYSNEAKVEEVEATSKALKSAGAVSAIVAEQMARGALKKSRADIAISTTGIAGPSGGSKKKPVGLVYLGLAVKKGRSMEVTSFECYFPDTRAIFKMQATKFALNLLLTALS